jgi:hypothetical protein
VNKVSCFEHPGAASLSRYDDDIGQLDGLVENECLSSRSQNGHSNAGYTSDDGPHQCHYRQDP